MKKRIIHNVFFFQPRHMLYLAAFLLILQAPTRSMSQQGNENLNALRAQARVRMHQDRDDYSHEELQKIQQLYSRTSFNTPYSEAKMALDKLYREYPKANRVGCAMLYVGRRSEAPTSERIFLLKKAIEEYSDSFYGDGVQVGALARVELALIFDQKGEHQKAEALRIQVSEDYPNSVFHDGTSLESRMAGHRRLYAPQLIKESLPSPERGRLNLDELRERLYDYDGKIIETSINRITAIQQIDSRWTQVNAAFSHGTQMYSTIAILVPNEGVPFFRMVQQTTSNRSVYLRVRNNTPLRITGHTFVLEAVGTRYSRHRDEYSW